MRPYAFVQSHMLRIEIELSLLTDFDDLPVQRWPPADALRRRAYQLRDNISAHDGAYVALAEALQCPLLTRDARLTHAAGHSAKIIVR